VHIFFIENDVEILPAHYTIIYGFCNKLECLSLITGILKCWKGLLKHLTMLEKAHINTRLSWKGLPGSNTLAIMSVISFMIQAPGLLLSKVSIGSGLKGTPGANTLAYLAKVSVTKGTMFYNVFTRRSRSRRSPSSRTA
jgi:hypothetical protein